MAKSSSSLAIMVFVVLGLLGAHMTAAQNCSAGLSRLTVCAPYVVPGVSNGPPSPECCTAISGVDTHCLCNAIDIIQRLPSTCSIAPVSCSA